MINRIVINNFKSIRHLDLELRPLNVLIGANGSGKSNLIGFLEMWREILDTNLQGFVAANGGANNLLHFGMKTSKELNGVIYFDTVPLKYFFELRPNNNYSLYFERDDYVDANDADRSDIVQSSPKGAGESITYDVLREVFKFKRSKEFISISHFSDTSISSPLRQRSNVSDNKFLKEDGSNLASFLYYVQVKHPKVFIRIEAIVRSVCKFFHEFDLAPDRLADNLMQLEWRHKNSNAFFHAQHLSDGSISFIALATLLLQPNPPKLIIIDQPELGLHPFAIEKLAALIKMASKHTQVIIATQSSGLISNFDPEDIITVDWEEGQSVFKRHTTDELSVWLEDYSLGEIWDKNIIGGQP